MSENKKNIRLIIDLHKKVGSEGVGDMIRLLFEGFGKVAGSGGDDSGEDVVVRRTLAMQSHDQCHLN